MKINIRPSQVILFFVCLSIGLGFALLCRMLILDLEAQTLQATEEVMVDVAYRQAQQIERELIGSDGDLKVACEGSLLRKPPHLEVKPVIYQLRKDSIGLDFYVVDKNGLVIFDSSGQSEGLNFSEYNDVYQTLRGQYGARSSRAVESDDLSSILYIGAPIHYQNQIVGVLTAYKAQRDVLPFILDRRAKILKVCALIALGMTLFVGGVFFWVYRPIGLLTRYAQGVIEGKRPRFPSLGKGREIQTLGAALMNMRETLEGREYAKNYVQTLTHEMKSPLAAIKATAELLQEEMRPEQRMKFMQSLIREVDRSEKVLTRLQQLSLIEGMSELVRQEVIAVDGILDELLLEYEASLQTKQLKVLKDLQPCALNGDPFLLRSAFQNLIDNAIKYAPEGGSILIEVKASDDENISVSIGSEGEPIPSYAHERMFERFYALDSSKQRKGCGIGLALVREAVSLHAGEVHYQYIDERNTFIVELSKRH